MKDVTGAGYLIKSEDVQRELLRHGGFGVPVLRRAKVVGSDSPQSSPVEPSGTEPGSRAGGSDGGSSTGGNGNGGE